LEITDQKMPQITKIHLPNNSRSLILCLDFEVTIMALVMGNIEG
jgi:hypothetical protein